MKIIKNFPEETTTVITAVEEQAIEDCKHGLDELENAEKELQKNLKEEPYFTGAPEQEKPEEVVVPEPLHESLTESRLQSIVSRIVRRMLGKDVDIYIDNFADSPDTFIVQFTTSDKDEREIDSDKLRQKIVDEINDEDIKVSCSTFKSANMTKNKTKYSIKMIVFNQRKETEND